MNGPYIVPDWPVPEGVQALMTTRHGGVSTGRWASMNLRWPEPGASPHDSSDQDLAQAVAENRRRFAQALGAAPVFIRQVHGAEVLRWSSLSEDSGNAFQEPSRKAFREGAHTGAHNPPFPAAPGAKAAEAGRSAEEPLTAGIETGVQADACITVERGWACTVLVADCLPVLLACDGARAVGAAHAGWRGLAAGVLDNTVQALCSAAGCEPREVQAWLGPCIGPQAFEVGADVLEAFGAEPASRDQAFFAYRPRADGSPRWRADLAGLARARLQALGLDRISGGGWCTVTQAADFYSFRREGATGRMAAAIALL